MKGECPECIECCEQMYLNGDKCVCPVCDIVHSIDNEIINTYRQFLRGGEDE